jgi:hypothetical protein
LLWLEKSAECDRGVLKLRALWSASVGRDACAFKHFGEQDFKLNRSGENQQLNNESDLRGRIQQNVLQSSSPRNIPMFAETF